MSTCVHENSWSCARCSTVNNKDNRSCTCCYFSKDASYKRPTFGGHSVPGLAQSLNRVFGDDKVTEERQKADVKTQNVPLPYKSGASNQTWSCPSCSLDNCQDKEECACSQTKKSQTNALLSKKPEEIESFMTGRAKEADLTSKCHFATSDATNSGNSKWQCPTCLVENQSDVNECVCCQCKNPSGNPSSDYKSATTTTTPFSFGSQSAKVEEPQRSVIKFGCQSNNSKGFSVGVTFGSAVSDKKVSGENCSSLFGAPREKTNALSGIKFGNSVIVKKTAEEEPSFLFGAKSKNPLEGIRFGSNVIDKKDSEENKSFVFGANREKINSTERIKFGSNVIDNKCVEEKSSFLFGTPTEKTNASSDIKFGSSLNENKDSEEHKSFLFAAKSNNPLAGVRFGSVGNDKDSNTFGAAAGNANSAHSTFGNQSMSFGAPIAMATGEGGSRWRCTDCMVENAADCDKCVCCTAAGPNVSSRVTVAAPARIFGSPAFALGSAPMSNGGLFGVVKGDTAAAMEFAFRQADSVPFESKIDIEADIEFAFSPAAVV